MGQGSQQLGNPYANTVVIWQVNWPPLGSWWGALAAVIRDYKVHMLGVDAGNSPAANCILRGDLATNRAQEVGLRWCNQS
jgi:hypothetical protein